ncbi:dephospho-CoA kinase [Ceratobasidium sp. AG-Ba]|nr:dephospho-CoA kinase [Ceratobasidium sp. AG-Ba]
MQSDATSELIREFVTAGGHLFASRYLTLAGFVLLIYDHIITLGSEIDFVWPAKRSAVKILFLINRYVVPVFIAFDFAFLTGWVPWLTDKL